MKLVAAASVNSRIHSMSWAYNSRMKTQIISFALVLTASFAAAQNAAPTGGASDAGDLIKQARKANSEGKQDEAIALYRHAEQASPNSYEAYVGEGVALDLKRQYDQARRQLTKAVELAPPDAKSQVLRTLAISYAFTRQAKEAAHFAERAFDAQLAKPDYYNAGEVADELARIYLESNDPENALKWYRTGYDTGLKEPNITQARKDLWEFRWQNAQARVAARKGNAEEAKKHVAAARAVLDRGTNADQERFYPYLTGYVAWALGDYTTAIADLQRADQRDPFILLLEAESYEKLNNAQQAKDLYQKILTFNTHNPPNAFARPVAEQKLGRS
jgi:tetratricopeptide (TPR) repeat protein